MKILILSCNTGEGHNSCARAISEELERKGDWGYIADGLAFLSTGTSKFVSGWHTRLYRYFPRLYGKGYEYAEKHPMNIKKHTAAYRMIRRGAKRLRKVIKAGGYDGVICTHLFPAMMVTGLVKKGTVTIPACFVATDYTASPGCEKVGLPTITPHPDLTGEFQAVGIPAENILAYGIPVRSMFTEKTDKAEAKRKAGLDPERLHMVIMGGSMGCGPMEDVLAEIAAGMPENIELTVICGTNKQTAEKLRRRHGENPRVHIRGYVKDMSLMLDSADLYLTKPGGISVTEAAEKRLPMILIDTVAGCEDYNLQFFVNLGAAKTADSEEAIAALCLDTLRSDGALCEMSAAYDRREAANGARYICDILDPPQKAEGE